MAEIIGVVAAAAQLSAVCVRLIDFTKKIKGGSSTLRKHHEQLQELHNLSDKISRNPLLQTSEVESHTRNLLSILSRNNLGPLLQKSRFRRTIHFIHLDRTISNLFNDLEKQKATLSLIISDIQSKTLYQIQADIKTMAGNSSSWNDDSGCEAESHIGDDDTDEKVPEGSSQTVQALSATGPSLSSQAQHLPTGSASTSWRDYPDLRRYDALDKLARENSWYNTNSSVWIECKAGDGVDQVNGISIRGSDSLSDSLAEQYVNTAPKNKPRYVGCTKSGMGDQTNGLELEYSTEATEEGRADLDAHYNGAVYLGCDFNPGETQNVKSRLGVQTQGIKLVPKEVSRGRGDTSKSREVQHNGAESRAHRKKTKK